MVSQDCVTLDLIVLCKVRLIERVLDHRYCLHVETVEDKAYYFAFDCEETLYTWLTDIHSNITPYSKPTNVQHVVHVEPDESDKRRLIVSRRSDYQTTC